jgi:predicted transposase YbfD/YdcC
METFEACFSELPDPRAANTVHDLTEVLFIALTAVLCGAEGCTDMADFGRAKEALLRRVLPLEGGIPSHDTFSRVFRVLDPVAFEAAFRRFMAAFAHSRPLTGVVAIDGKAVRGAFERGRKSTPLHLVNVWAAEARLVLAQRTAPDRNEVAGALEVLELLSLEGCIVTADALHCHRAMAAAILGCGADYALAVKDNRPGLRIDAVRWINAAGRGQSDRAEQEQLVSHGRYEWREAVVAPAADMARAHDFPGIQAVARVTSRRRVAGKDAQVAVRYFLLSRRLSASRLLEVVRQHWTIENQLHWVLDVVFDEDRARNRKDHGPENISILRKLALNLLRSHPDKASIRRKVKRAGWDDAFLLSIIAHMR